MKVTIGVYESHAKAVLALQELQKSGFSVDQLSIIGKAELIDDHLYVRTKDNMEKAEVSIGAVGGTVLGILTGVGVFAIPGLGLLYGAGAFFGALFGLWGGIMAGGFGMILTNNLGIEEAAAMTYVKHLSEGKFLVLAQGNEEQIKKAHEVLNNHVMSVELAIH